MITGNEPAMPVVDPIDGQVYGGLTTRELLSAMALQGMLANPATFNIFSEKGNPNDAAEFYALCSVEHADALIVELNKQVKNP